MSTPQVCHIEFEGALDPKDIRTRASYMHILNVMIQCSAHFLGGAGAGAGGSEPFKQYRFTRFQFLLWQTANRSPWTRTDSFVHDFFLFAEFPSSQCSFWCQVRFCYTAPVNFKGRSFAENGEFARTDIPDSDKHKWRERKVAESEQKHHKENVSGESCYCWALRTHA